MFIEYHYGSREEFWIPEAISIETTRPSELEAKWIRSKSSSTIKCSHIMNPSTNFKFYMLVSNEKTLLTNSNCVHTFFLIIIWNDWRVVQIRCVPPEAVSHTLEAVESAVTGEIFATRQSNSCGHHAPTFFLWFLHHTL
jgi:hypothetical protein